MGRDPKIIDSMNIYSSNPLTTSIGSRSNIYRGFKFEYLHNDEFTFLSIEVRDQIKQTLESNKRDIRSEKPYKIAQQENNDPVLLSNPLILEHPPPPPPSPVFSPSAKTKGPVKKWSPVQVSTPQQEALRSYSAQNYRFINSHLRGLSDLTHADQKIEYTEMLLSRGYLNTSEPTLEELNIGMAAYVNDVDNGIAELPSTDHSVTYRGIALDHPGLEGFKEKHLTVGETLLERGYLSTSPEKAWINDTIIRFELPEGHKGRILGKRAQFKTEEEMLFPSNTQYVIKEVIDKSSPDFAEHVSKLPLDNSATADPTKIQRIITAVVVIPESE